MKKEKRSYLVKGYLTKDEYEKILQWSNQTGLSISTFIQRVCTGQRVESKIDQQTRIELRKINADLGRLGGLLKHALTQTDEPHKLRFILRDIERVKDDFKRKINQL